MGTSILRVATLVGAAVVICSIILIDVHTTLWQELVVLSGLAAGLVTFLLTTLFIDRALQRSQAKRQAPIRRLALTELLHGIADEDRSALTRGVVVPRKLPSLQTSDDADLSRQIHQLLHAADTERRNLAKILGTWALFFTSNDGEERLVEHVARNTLRFETVRDAALALEASIEAGGDRTAALSTASRQIEACNHGIEDLARHLESELQKT